VDAYEELLFGNFWCPSPGLEDSYTSTLLKNGSYRPDTESNAALEWSVLNYSFKRSKNGSSVSCTKTYTAHVYPVKEMVIVLGKITISFQYQLNYKKTIFPQNIFFQMLNIKMEVPSNQHHSNYTYCKHFFKISKHCFLHKLSQ
jgi:hypothetical protein